MRKLTSSAPRSMIRASLVLAGLVGASVMPFTVAGSAEAAVLGNLIVTPSTGQAATTASVAFSTSVGCPATSTDFVITMSGANLPEGVNALGNSALPEPGAALVDYPLARTWNDVVTSQGGTAPIDGVATLKMICAGPGGNEGEFTTTVTFAKAASGVDSTFTAASAPPAFQDAATSTVASTGGLVMTNAVASPQDPIGTSVTVPSGVLAGPVSIDETAAPADPTPAGFVFIGKQVLITAPEATVATPLRLRFLLDNFLIGMRGNPTVFRNGVAVAQCSTTSGAPADPNPCVESVLPEAGGDVLITVRTATAGRWAFGQPATPPPPPIVASVCAPGSPAPAGFTLKEGTAGDDILVGTAGADLLRGLGGDDILIGREGNDIICGGTGRDLMSGGNGNDLLSGEDNSDVAYGGAGNDLMLGGGGNDFLRGGNGNDRILGGDGDDWLFGDNGNDLLVGGLGKNRISGGLGGDRSISDGKQD